MKLSIEHRTSYRFDSPMTGVIQVHRLTPADTEGQLVLDWEVDTGKGITGGLYRDAAGDLISNVSWRGAVDHVDITVRGTVETHDTAGILRGHRERAVPTVYLRHTHHTKPDAELRKLAEEVLAKLAESAPLDIAHGLSNAVADAITYAPGETEAHTTAAEALVIGKGVCQDHAHALIALANVAGIPARYVSGYLHANTDESQYEAAHAWGELFLPELGWVGFDPSNRCCPDENYVRLGSGLDAVSAAPIRGVSNGPGLEAMDVQVAVEAQQQ